MFVCIQGERKIVNNRKYPFLMVTQTGELTHISLTANVLGLGEGGDFYHKCLRGD
jgi:hypothetical protein